MRKKAGYVPPKTEKKEVVISVRFTEEEHDRILFDVMTSGMKRAELLEQIIMDGLNRRGVPKNPRQHREGLNWEEFERWSA